MLISWGSVTMLCLLYPTNFSVPIFGMFEFADSSHTDTEMMMVMPLVIDWKFFSSLQGMVKGWSFLRFINLTINDDYLEFCVLFWLLEIMQLLFPIDCA